MDCRWLRRVRDCQATVFTAAIAGILTCECIAFAGAMQVAHTLAILMRR
jgi:hypothetical protein